MHLRLHVIVLLMVLLVSLIDEMEADTCTIRDNVKVTYIRWGRTSCPKGAAIVYAGQVGGPQYSETGGGSNYQCLPLLPQWGSYTSGKSIYSAFMYGAEYQVRSSDHPNPFNGENAPIPGDSNSLHDRNVPCVVCSVPRSTSLMIPAWKQCPDGWHFEYNGYLVTENKNYNRRTFECMDEAPEALPGGESNQDGALFHAVKASCGSLSCPYYKDNAELTCVVCTS